MLATDYVGIGALISAIGAAAVSVIVAWRQTSTKTQVGDIHAAVSTSNGTTLAGVVEKIDRATETETPTPEVKP